MKTLSTAFFFFFTFLLNAQSNLLPQPKEIEINPGTFQLNSKTIIQLKDGSISLNKYVDRFISRLQSKTGLFLKTPFIQDTVSNNCISIQVENKIDSLYLGMDESYSIQIKSNTVQLTANSNIGAYRGLETLLQLTKTKGKNTYYRNTMINDSPRFPWRGLMIDVCRHWIPEHVVKRNIDAMALVKMNVLHLHLTEDQAFRIECKAYPKLHQLGNNGNYYTQKQIKSIVMYAKERGIRVIPEFDIPGHATSWAVGYPKLASEKNRTYELETSYGVFNPTLDPTKEETYTFLKTFFTEMVTLFPDAYIHIGGDENKGKQWDGNSKIQKFMNDKDFKTNHELQSYFNQRVLSILTKLNKKMVGWDEILEASLPKEIAVQAWQGKDSLYQVAKKGHPGLLSYGYYLDMAYRAKTYYENDPLPPDNKLTIEERKNILGGEAAIWSELVNEKTIDSRIWPVTAAIAERLWSTNENCNTEKLYSKLPSISSQLESVGLQHLSYRTPLLKEISNLNDVTGIIDFVNLLEPLKGYKRHRFITYKTHYPLSRLVDACYTESYSSKNFKLLAKTNCVQSGVCRNRDKIKAQLKLWIKSTEAFIKVADQSIALSEAKPIAYKALELMELSWGQVNSPTELNITQKERAQILISELRNYKLDCKFVAIEGIELLFKK
jgi:hexosaminidase